MKPIIFVTQYNTIIVTNSWTIIGYRNDTLSLQYLRDHSGSKNGVSYITFKMKIDDFIRYIVADTKYIDLRKVEML